MTLSSFPNSLFFILWSEFSECHSSFCNLKSLRNARQFNRHRENPVHMMQSCHRQSENALMDVGPIKNKPCRRNGHGSLFSWFVRTIEILELM